jgi:hypothetical protein
MEQSWECAARTAARKDALVDFLEQFMHLEGSDPEEIADALLTDAGLEALGFVGEWGYGYIDDSAEAGFNVTADLDDAIYGSRRKPEITGDQVIRRWYRREYFEATGDEAKKARENRVAKAEAAKARDETRRRIEADHRDALDAIQADYLAKIKEIDA